jgi:peptidoglycan/LPS O-acetylase OafA/YrhL
MRRFRDLFDTPRWLTWSLPLFCIVYGLRLTALLSGADVPPVAARLLSLCVGATGLMSLFLLRRSLTNAALAWLGPFAFGVYLLHVFSAAAARILLESLGIEANPLLFVVCLAAGIGLPVLFQMIFARYALVSWLVLGQKPARRSGGNQPALETRSEPDRD